MKLLNKPGIKMELANHETIIKKNEILESAKRVLKSEYFGIDNIIEQLIDSIRSWYIFPQLQTRPTVVNLWGLTGVGKTSLLSKLIELIGESSRKIDFNLNVKNSTGIVEIPELIKEISLHHKSKQFVFIFDEFQYARTINEHFEEIKNDTTAILWQMLGDGYFNFWELTETNDIEILVSGYTHAIKKGLIVKNGKIINNKEVLFKYLDLYDSLFTEIIKEEETDYLFPDLWLDTLHTLTKGEITTKHELRTKLNKFDAHETITFIKNAIKKGYQAQRVDCSQSLVFIVGNLDEAYNMSGDFNPDISADELYKQTLKIDLPSVKKVLKQRFRVEQIARLGNTHLIYPSLSSDAYKSIINKELENIAKRFEENFNIKITIDDSLKKLIYSEGVFPTQGARQVFSTIETIFSNNIAKVYYEKEVKRLQVDNYCFSTKHNNLIVDYYYKGNKVYDFKIELNLTLGKLREVKSNDKQVVIAVHESGHAIVSALLLKRIPEKIVSVSADKSMEGFTFLNNDNFIISKKTIDSQLAVYLAGYCAEKIVFGEENITAGSSSDIESATNFVAEMIKKYGLGSVLGNYDVMHIDTNLSLFDDKYELNKEIKTIINNSLILAETTLNDNKTLLLQMAKYLSINSFMDKKTAQEMVIQFASHSITKEELEADKSIGFYSNCLNELTEQSCLKVVN